MIVGHPQSASWAVSGGAAVDAVGDILLNDPRPDTLTAFSWASGAQNTSTTVTFTGTFSTAFVPRLVYLANTSLPTGLKVEVKWKRQADAGYTYAPTAYNNPATIVEGPRGERTLCVLLKPGADPVVGVQVILYNDVGGVSPVVAEAIHTIGALLTCSGTEVQLAGGAFSIDTIDPSTSGTSSTRRYYYTPQVTYRQMTAQLLTADQSVWFSVYDKLVAKIDRGQFNVWVPRYVRPDGTFDSTILHGLSMIGVATKLPAKKHAALGLFDATAFTVDEAPIPA